MKEILQKILDDPRYRRNIEYGELRSGHPEGKVRHHIAELEANLSVLARRGISENDAWKLKFLIHQDVSILHPCSHASLAREYASRFTDDTDLLNMLQFHDENYALWLQYIEEGEYDEKRFENLLNTIKDWDLFLMFIIIDGSTSGKEISKLSWFINEVRKHKDTRVDESWVLSP